MRPRIDAHVHVWGDGVEHEFAPLGGAAAPTSTAALDELLREGARDLLGVLLIQPSQYGYDHTHLLAAAHAHEGPPELRIMPLVDPEATSAMVLEQLAALPGFAGVRVVARDRQGTRALDLATTADFWRAAAEQRRTVGVLLEPHRLEQLRDVLRRHPDLVVIVDHLARLSPRQAGHDEHLATLVDLARHPGVHVKLSALDALSSEPPPYRDMWPTVDAVLTAFGPDRCLYGSDWPYRREFGSLASAQDALLAALEHLGSADVVARLDDTARRVLGFGAVATGQGPAARRRAH